MPAKKVTRSERICRALKAAQNAKGYTQSDVAKKMGVKSQSIISQWYNNTGSMQVAKFERLCMVLDINPQDILSIK